MERKIIYCFPNKSTFVLKDISILSNSFNVVFTDYSWSNKLKLPYYFIRQFFFLLKHLKSSNGVLIMFAGFWSVVPVFLAKFFSKPSYLILGGTDCVSYPDLNYGSLRKKGLKKAISYSVKNCTALLPVARELIDHENIYYNTPYKKQGLKAFFPELDTPVFEIANGYEFSNERIDYKRVENSFISVALVNDEVRYVLKGFDKIRLLAENNPNNQFTLIGLSEAIIDKYFKAFTNVTCYGALSSLEIEQLLVKHEFYLQLSISEGHPNALCEGMINGCIPIGSNVTSIPRLIGISGFVIDKRDDVHILDVVNQALELSKEEKNRLSLTAQEIIKNNYNLSNRESKLTTLF